MPMPRRRDCAAARNEPDDTDRKRHLETTGAYGPSKTYCHGAHFRDKGKALFSDNYFDLLPGIPKSITCPVAKVPGEMQFHAVT